MVTPEERITRLEAMQETNIRQWGEVVSRLDQILVLVEATRREAQEANEAVRKEARETNDATRRELVGAIEAARLEARDNSEAARKESRESIEAARLEARDNNEAARKESRESIEAARRDSRNLFIAGFSIGAALFTGLGVGTITLLFSVLERLPA